MRPNQTTDVHPRRFTRGEYERMIDAGVLGTADRVELIEGEILVMSPEKSRHAAAIDIVAEVLRQVFGSGRTVRIQHPLALGQWSEPEPDLCVVEGSPRDYVSAHPTTALLVVEVADTSLQYDRTTKAELYARAALAEYWIINLVDACIEVHRNPSGTGYLDITRYETGATLSPLAHPDAPIPTADLLP